MLRFAPAPRCAGQAPQIFLIPPVIGVHSVLRDGFIFVAEALSARGYPSTVVSFPGQSGNEGDFSVARSCDQLRALLNEERNPFLLFGICTGALAALAAAARNSLARGVLCWDLSSKIEYSEQAKLALAERYGIRFCEASALVPVQAAALVPLVSAPITFASPRRSLYTRPTLQRALAAMASDGEAYCVENAGHFPGVPHGSERVFAEMIAGWADRLSANRPAVGQERRT